MGKLLEIFSCEKCDDRTFRTISFTFWCARKQKSIETMGIPSWCPLPDAPGDAPEAEENEMRQCLNCGGHHVGDICPQCRNIAT